MNVLYNKIFIKNMHRKISYLIGYNNGSKYLGGFSPHKFFSLFTIIFLYFYSKFNKLGEKSR